MRPAQLQLHADGLVSRVAFLDVLRHCPIALSDDGTDGKYFPTEEGCLLPLDELAERGLLGSHVLALVCTPTPYHMLYAKQILGTGCRIAVEKPLTLSLAAAESLLPFKDAVFSIGHQLFKADMLSFLTRCRTIPEWPRQLTAISFDLWETKGVGDRAIDDVVWDLGWHGFECILAPLRAAGHSPAIVIDQVYIATYEPAAGQSSPPSFTAACIKGWVQLGERNIPFLIRVGKGLGKVSKQLRFQNGGGGPPKVIDLQESGWRAHYRLLRELPVSPQPDLKLTLADAVSVVRLCSQARRVAVDVGTYPFGTTPEFMEAEAFPEAPMDAAA